MGENTAIEWADYTFNGWWGCQKVSPGCDHCYAEALDARFGGAHWGPHAERKRTSAANWAKPLKWNRDAAAAGTRPFVFCASMADVFDNAVPPEWRSDLFDLIRATPHLVWLLLTKRPQNVRQLLPVAPDVSVALEVHVNGGGRITEKSWPANAALGVTVCNQEEAERNVPLLLDVPGPLFRFVSYEPALGGVDFELDSIWFEPCRRCDDEGYNEPDTNEYVCSGCDSTGKSDDVGIDWVIAGGESGPKARPAHPDWFRSVRDQCAAAGVPFLFKQWGEWGPNPSHGGVFDVTNRGRLVQPYADEPNRFHAYPEDMPVVDGGLIGRFDTLRRVGKKRAGRMLDGVLHDARPTVPAIVGAAA